MSKIAHFLCVCTRAYAVTYAPVDPVPALRCSACDCQALLQGVYDSVPAALPAKGRPA